MDKSLLHISLTKFNKLSLKESLKQQNIKARFPISKIIFAKPLTYI